MITRRLGAKRDRQTKQKIMAILSLLFFCGATSSGIIKFLKKVGAESIPVESQSSLEDPLQQQAKGYELVLQREPENQAALEGLVDTRLQLNDQKGAIEPLEKLVKLRPERTDYTTLLNQLQEEAQ